MNKLIQIAIFFLALSFSAKGALYNPDHVQVYVVPLNDFPEIIAVQLAKALSDDLGFWVKSSLRLGDLDVDVMPGTNQLPSETVIDKSQQVIKSLPEASKSTYFLLLTTRDINSQSRGFRFQFSTHNKNLNTSVVSMARLLDYKDNKPVLNRIAITRLFKMSKRAIGELHLGWKRSSNPDDIMYSPLMGLPDLDKIGINHVEVEQENPAQTHLTDQGAI